MKTILTTILMAFLAIGCTEYRKDSTDTRELNNRTIEITKIVKGKTEATKTTLKYKYNIWKDNFYHQPDVHTVFIITYNDGTTEEVDFGKYATTNIGDTITYTRTILE